MDIFSAGISLRNRTAGALPPANHTVSLSIPGPRPWTFLQEIFSSPVSDHLRKQVNGLSVL